MIVPPYLKKNDTIGIVCPSGFMPIENVQPSIQTLHEWGYPTQLGTTVGHQFNYFSGTDEERLNDLQRMLDDKNIKAILCARGGYGLSRIIDKINFTKFKQHPKWLIGYSDVTVLHAHINSHVKTASLHSPMAGAFNNAVDAFSLQTLRKALKGVATNYSCAAHPFNRQGIATGELVGGNLAIIAHLIGSASSYQTKNKILVLEDVGEYIYNIDRMFLQLKRSGMLQNLAGLIIGDFSEMKDTVVPYGADVYAVIHRQVKDYSYPVCFNFPVGHDTRNYALKMGVKHQLKVLENKTILKEIDE
jgi:muramoyltetrapeptide carboxypeptidase